MCRKRNGFRLPTAQAKPIPTCRAATDAPPRAPSIAMSGSPVIDAVWDDAFEGDEDARVEAVRAAVAALAQRLGECCLQLRVLGVGAGQLLQAA